MDVDDIKYIQVMSKDYHEENNATEHNGAISISLPKQHKHHQPSNANDTLLMFWKSLLARGEGCGYIEYMSRFSTSQVSE